MGSSDDRHDVINAFRFSVEIDGMIVAGFSHASGIEMEILTTELKEGGLNEYTRKIVIGTKYSPIVLKKGITTSNFFGSWCQAIASGYITRKDGAIILIGPDGQEFRRWNFVEAYPTKWTGPELDSMTPNVAFESVTLTHNGIKVVKSK